MEQRIHERSEYAKMREALHERLKLEAMPLLDPLKPDENFEWTLSTLECIHDVYELALCDDRSQGTAKDARETLEAIEAQANNLAVSIHKATWEVLDRLRTPGNDPRKYDLWVAANGLKAAATPGLHEDQLPDGSFRFSPLTFLPDRLFALAKLARIGAEEVAVEFGKGGRRPYQARGGSPDFRLVQDCRDLLVRTARPIKHAVPLAMKIREIATGISEEPGSSWGLDHARKLGRDARVQGDSSTRQTSAPKPMQVKK
ncbi:MAG TPA: hypothetical protein VFF76_04555 [Holophagaceae bacterium]|nr:hypothetical protein [Holophagaceae bacterium]